MRTLDPMTQEQPADEAARANVITRRLASADREQDSLDWLRSARSYPGRVWASLDPHPFPLIVIAEDKVAPAKGFGLHGHSDVEVISYVIAGALEHADSRGNAEVLRRGEIQLMTAGRGIQHSEYNGSATQPVHFLQIWVTPDRPGLPPGYASAQFATDAPLTLLAAPSGGLVPLSQELAIWRAAPGHGDVDLQLSPASRSWIHVIHGPVWMNGISINRTMLSSGDGLALTGVRLLSMRTDEQDAEALVFTESLPTVSDRCPA